MIIDGNHMPWTMVVQMRYEKVNQTLNQSTVELLNTILVFTNQGSIILSCSIIW